MAYHTPKVPMTVRGQGRRPARCPGCGKSEVMLYVATDTARCQSCSRCWHPSDSFYKDLRGTDAARETYSQPRIEPTPAKADAPGRGAADTSEPT